jgi:hypothetical protein
MYARNQQPFLGENPTAARTPAPVDPGMPYSYGVEALALAGNASIQKQIQVVNHDFKAYFLMGVSTGKFSCKIRVGDRYLSNIAIHSDNLFGSSVAPMPLLSPIMAKKNDLVIFEITDLSGAPNDIRISLNGIESSN